ncbi:hypothetical protein HAZT_HAZT008252 [Hyalella azteca]|uniref:Uncharacterized protein n=1 Tax=Hyalella azteca TaxID=294128 RepID=A0A6A0H3A0_HYAAZ|nr:hypothetical protein HAZT_HAZT008252 [Hyalella azteca]
MTLQGEKVLCFHGPLIYEAKCLKVQAKEKEKPVKYLVHYAGWNKKKQKKAAKKFLEKKREGGSGGSKGGAGSGGEDSRSSTPSTDSSSKRTSSAATADAAQSSDTENKDDASDAKKKKLKLDSTVESEEQFLGHVEVRIKLPDELKPCLVDDWDLVNRQRKLTTLPARVTVSSILADYTKAKINTKANTPNKESAILEVVAGLKEYFNVMLGKQLLYKFERPQYADWLREHPDTPLMSEVYGYIHLVRLFVKMGEMLAYTQLDEKSIAMLNFHLHDFLR